MYRPNINRARATALAMILASCAQFTVIGVASAQVSEIIVDNTSAILAGDWATSTYQPNYFGTN
jgi:hypothetical protein